MQRYHCSTLTSIIIVQYVFSLSFPHLTDYICQADPRLIITVSSLRPAHRFSFFLNIMPLHATISSFSINNKFSFVHCKFETSLLQHSSQNLVALRKCIPAFKVAKMYLSVYIIMRKSRSTNLVRMKVGSRFLPDHFRFPPLYFAILASLLILQIVASGHFPVSAATLCVTCSTGCFRFSRPELKSRT